MTELEKQSYYESEAAAVQYPFLGLALFIVLIATVFFFVKLPKLINESQTGSYKEVLKNKEVVLGVLGIFFYVGAEVAIGSYLINYFLDMNLDDVIKNSDTMSSIAASLLNSDLALKDSKAIVGVFVTFYWSGAMIGFTFCGSLFNKNY